MKLHHNMDIYYNLIFSYDPLSLEEYSIKYQEFKWKKVRENHFRDLEDPLRYGNIRPDNFILEII